MKQYVVREYAAIRVSGPGSMLVHGHKHIMNGPAKGPIDAANLFHSV